MNDLSWVPDACTLPSREQPLRVAEFAELFASALGTVTRLEPGRLRLDLKPSAQVEATVRDLVARESACCSFFTFTITSGDPLVLDIAVAPGHEPVLEALAGRAVPGGRRPTP